MEANKAELVAVAPNLREFSAAGLYKQISLPDPSGRLEIFQGQEHRGQGIPVNEERQPAGAAEPPSAASEERMLLSAEEFAASASKTTVFLTNLLQALLVACVVFWVMDVPRRVFDVSFYTEQLLTVCLGLTLALAFMVETQRAIPRDRLGRRDRGRHYPRLYGLPFSQSARHSAAVVGGARARAGLDLLASRPKFARAFDWSAPPCHSCSAATSPCATSR